MYHTENMDDVQQIKDRLSIVEVVGQYVKLTRAGKNYKGLSPFKKEKTPSFYVSPDKGMYYDFSSNRGGDIFTFVQEIEGVDFRGALTLLAQRAGVLLHTENRAARDARDRLYDVLEAACVFYEQGLAGNDEARAYLADRGCLATTAQQFRLGFAPDAWRTLHEHLRAQGYTDTDIETAGLSKRPSSDEHGAYYDRFRSRIMFPIADASGRIVAFSGRIFGPAAADERNAKYLNSPETPLFDKGRVLYGFDRARHAMRTATYALLVEGQMDLVLCHQAGFPQTVAVSGTGLTDDHLTLVARMTNTLLLALDGDSAGEASTVRAATMALERGMEVRVVRIPSGKDPADAIRTDVGAWRQAVTDARHIVAFLLESAARAHAAGGDARAFELHVRDSVLPFVARVKSSVDRAHWVRTVANALSLPADAVGEEVQLLARTEKRAPPVSAPPEAPQQQEQPAPTRRGRLEREIAGILFWQEGAEQAVVGGEAVASLSQRFDLQLEGTLARHAHDRDALALHAEVLHETTRDLPAVLEALLRDLARLSAQEEQQRITRELRHAELLHDEARTEELLAAFAAVTKRLELYTALP